MKLFYEYMVIFFNLSPTSSHLHPRLVVDEDDNAKAGLKELNHCYWKLNHSLNIKICKFFISNSTIICNFKPLEVVGRGSDTQLQAVEN